MVLAVLAEIGAVGVDDRGGVVVDARHRALVDRDDHRHLVLAGVGDQLLDGGTRDGLGEGVPLLVLAGAEVRAIEDLLEPEDLDTGFACLVDVGQVLLEHRVGDFLHGSVGVVDGVGELDQSALDHACHQFLLGLGRPRPKSGDASAGRMVMSIGNFRNAGLGLFGPLVPVAGLTRVMGHRNHEHSAVLLHEVDDGERKRPQVPAPRPVQIRRPLDGALENTGQARLEVVTKPRCQLAAECVVVLLRAPVPIALGSPTKLSPSRRVDPMLARRQRGRAR